MPDPKQIPYLLDLLDDNSAFVLKEVTKALNAFGADLPGELKKIPLILNAKQKKALVNILEVYNRRWLRSVWPGWLELKSDKERLEGAYEVLAQFQSGLPLEKSLKTLLDELAQEFYAARIKKDAYGLAYFLFEVKGLKGAMTDYYNPQNSNLVYVISEKRGIPISLVSVYMLVASRLGLEVEGCNFPGHFLARIELNGRKVLVDCFKGGRILNEKEISQLNAQGSSMLGSILQENTPAETIISRVLGNLIQAYEQEENLENSRLMFELLSTLEISNLRVKP